MKQSFFLYALILSLVFNIYTYMYLSKEVTFEQEKYKNKPYISTNFKTIQYHDEQQ